MDVQTTIQDLFNYVSQMRVDHLKRAIKRAIIVSIQEILTWIFFKWIVPSLKALALIGFNFSISLLVHYLLRRQLVPNALIDEPLYFNHKGVNPVVKIDLLSAERQWYYVQEYSDPFYEKYKYFLHSGTKYNIDAIFELAKSPRNYEVGKVAATLTMVDTSGDSIAKSVRPVYIPFQSQTSLFLESIVLFPLRLVGILPSAETVIVQSPLMHNFMEPLKSHPSTQYVELTLSSSKLDLQDARLKIIPQVTGLSYYLYYHPHVTWVVFVWGLSFLQFGAYIFIFMVSSISRVVTETMIEIDEEDRLAAEREVGVGLFGGGLGGGGGGGPFSGGISREDYHVVREREEHSLHVQAQVYDEEEEKLGTESPALSSAGAGAGAGEIRSTIVADTLSRTTVSTLPIIDIRRGAAVMSPIPSSPSSAIRRRTIVGEEGPVVAADEELFNLGDGSCNSNSSDASDIMSPDNNSSTFSSDGPSILFNRPPPRYRTQAQQADWQVYMGGENKDDDDDDVDRGHEKEDVGAADASESSNKSGSAVGDKGVGGGADDANAAPALVSISSSSTTLKRRIVATSHSK